VLETVALASVAAESAVFIFEQMKDLKNKIKNQLQTS